MGVHLRPRGWSSAGRRASGRRPGRGRAELARTSSASSSRSSPTSATSLVGERWKSIARSRWAKASGCLPAESAKRRKTPSARLLVGALAGQRREAQQAEGGGGVARGDRVVADLLAPGDQRFVVVGGREEAAALAVGEAGDHGVGEARGRARTRRGSKRRFVEGEQGLEQEGVVLEVGVEAGAGRPCRCGAGARRRRAARPRRSSAQARAASR